MRRSLTDFAKDVNNRMKKRVEIPKELNPRGNVNPKPSRPKPTTTKPSTPKTISTAPPKPEPKRIDPKPNVNPRPSTPKPVTTKKNDKKMISTAIGGASSLLKNSSSVKGAISGIGGAIGSLFGNNRSEKRKQRQKYWDALKGAGVRWNLIKNWHSDEHAAGQYLVSIIEDGGMDGVKYINRNLRGDVTKNKTQALEKDYQLHKSRNQNKSNQSTGSVGLPAGIPKIATLAGVGYLGKKLFLD